jgi:hypothetical protein
MNWAAVGASFIALGIVLLIQRKAGHRMAGLCVCLPLVSGPLTLALYLSVGAEVARIAVTGSIEEIGAAAIAITAFGLMRRWPILISIPLTIGIFVCAVLIKARFVFTIAQSVLVTAALIAICATIAKKWLCESSCAKVARKRSWQLAYFAPFALLAIALSTAPLLSVRLSGLLSSAPVLTLALLVSIRIGNDSAHGIAHAVQGGYNGMMAKLVFFVVILVFLNFDGLASIPLVCGTLIGIAVTLLLRQRKLEARQA